MNYRIARTIIDFAPPSLKPTTTPTHISTPVPTPVHPVSPTVTAGGGLTIALLIIVSLALVGLIAWTLWMLRTQRWVSAKSLRANRTNSQRTSVQEYSVPRVAQQAYQPYRAQAQSSPSEQQNFTPVRLAGEQMAQDQARSLPRTPPEDPLKNRPWLGLAEECVKLYDELDGLFPPSDPRQEVATHVMRRLQGILARSGVETIAHDRTYDIHRHLVVPPDLAARPGTPIARTVSPGFAVGSRVIRPAHVQVASSGGENMEEREIVDE
jgi:hypothetical protein